MKKFALLLAILVLVFVSGCAQKKPTLEEAWNASMEIAKEGYEIMNTEIERQQEVLEQKEADRKAIFLANQVSVSGAEIMKADESSILVKSYAVSDREDEKVITFTADFTNLFPGMDLSFGSLYPDVYQNGVKLNLTSFEFDKDVYTPIKTGKTLEISFSYILRDTTSAVEMEYNSFQFMIGEDDEVNSVCTIPLQ